MRKFPIRDVAGVCSYDKAFVYGRAAGRCCFRGCGASLVESYDADSADGSGTSIHLYAFDESAPARVAPAEQLVLLCQRCRRRVCDPRNAVTADDLRAYRAAHEARIRTLLGA